jgi:hypothetical protein
VSTTHLTNAEIVTAPNTIATKTTKKSTLSRSRR